VFTTGEQLVGTFDDVIFACHAPDTVKIMQGCENKDLLAQLGHIEYGDNVVYVHSDKELMPKRKSAWASWNCMGKSELLKSDQLKTRNKNKEAMEGGESGFGQKMLDIEKSTEEQAEGENERMKAVYITYYLNRLQNLDTSTDIFVSLNPHKKPDLKLIYHKQHMSHPQFTPQTLLARKEISEKYQGKDGLWFCGAWQGYGFHEDGCRSGFEVATSLSNIPLPWAVDKKHMVLPPPDLTKPLQMALNGGLFKRIHRLFTYTIPVTLSKKMILIFLRQAIKKGHLKLKMADGSIVDVGDRSPCGCDSSPVTLNIFDDWFFVKLAMEYDLGLARSYMAGMFNVEPLADVSEYDAVTRPSHLRDETNIILGDPVGLTRLFRLFVGNRDKSSAFTPQRSVMNHTVSNALSNAAGLFIAKFGSFANFLRFKITMDNSERGGSLKNIHAHYDLSNDLFRSFLDNETYMYSSAIYDAVEVPRSLSESGLAFKGTLEQAEWRKLDTLLARAQVQPGQTLLDIGFGWGGLSIHAAKKYGCKVTGITLSVEQKALAEERVKEWGVEHLITFEVVDYRTFARRDENSGKFDRVISCEMIEAVGHKHLGEFFWAVEQVLHPDGILVMEAITTPETRYETYLRSTDLINSIIFPGSCCPSLHALIDASYKWSTLTLEHIDNIGLHYAETLREWRRRFNNNEVAIRKLGFDDVFFRVWNYYLTYCEAGFGSQTENCLILVFSRQGCKSLVPLSETRCVTQHRELTEEEVEQWTNEK